MSAPSPTTVFTASSISVIGAINSWLAQSHAPLQATAAVIGIFSGLIAVISGIILIRKLSKEQSLADIQMAKFSADLCERCRDGHPPIHCPLKAENRPHNCPKSLLK